MKTASLIGCVMLGVMVAGFALPRAAQAAPREEKAPKPVKAVTPPKDAAALPVIEKATAPAAAVSFPDLPPSRVCAREDLRGLFRLVAVYEDPEGEEAASFRASPYQYYGFFRDNVFGRINKQSPDMAPKAIARELSGNASDMQFLLQDNGFLYFYQNSVAVDVQACFIVANDKLPFKAGQLLLMPPKGQITGRRVKVFESMRPKAGARGAKAGRRSDRPKGAGGRN